METTLSPDQFQQARDRFLWMLDDTLYRFENAGDHTTAEDVLVHGHELIELAWDLGSTDEPWTEYAVPDRPGFVLLENHDPVTGFSMDFYPEGGPVPVCLASVVVNTEPAERERFIKLLRLWRNYMVGLQAPSDNSEAIKKRGRRGMSDEDKQDDARVHDAYHAGVYADYTEAVEGLSGRFPDLNPKKLGRILDRVGHRRRRAARQKHAENPVK